MMRPVVLTLTACTLSLHLLSFASSFTPLRKNYLRHSSSGTSGIATAIIGTNDTSNSTTSISAEHVVLIDRRPHEQRVAGPRKARRLNHQFQHLYRHYDPRWKDSDWNDDDDDDDDDDHIHVRDEISIFYDTMLVSRNYSTLSLFQNGLPVSVSHPHNNANITRRTGLLAMQYLHQNGGYSLEEIYQMHIAFPPLLEMNVESHLRPKMRFLKDCLGGGASSSPSPSTNVLDQPLHPKLKTLLPANFYGSRLERTIAPRHAFLVHVGLPSGKALWDDTYNERHISNDTQSGGGSGDTTSLLEQFLLMHRKPKQFAAMCNNWRDLYGSSILGNDHRPISSEEIVAFDKLFQRGLLSAARDDSDYVFSDECSENDNDKNRLKVDSTSPSLPRMANVTSAQLVRYLIQHGSNPWETDVRGASLFHWAAGCGNLDGLQELVHCCNMVGYVPQGREDHYFHTAMTSSNPGVHAAILWKASRDDATPLHWAAAGAGPKEFGVGGHISVCSYLLSLCTEYKIMPARSLLNSQTKDGNTVLMWAAWSRSLDIVKFLVRNRADSALVNRNGCTVAHWASSGGDLSVCKYLHEIANVDFTTENHAGNTPLSHAVAYGRYEVAQWLKEELKVEDSGRSAENLAMDFVHWADTGVGLITADEEVERRRVYSLFNSFEDWTREEQER